MPISIARGGGLLLLRNQSNSQGAGQACQTAYCCRLLVRELVGCGLRHVAGDMCGAVTRFHALRGGLNPSIDVGLRPRADARLCAERTETGGEMQQCASCLQRQADKFLSVVAGSFVQHMLGVICP